MKFLPILLIYTIVALHTSAFAQDEPSMRRNTYFNPNMLIFSWEVAFPVNNDYLTKTSFAGGRIEYRRFIQKNISVGGAISWNSFEQFISRQTYQKPDGTGAINTDMVRQIYVTPITLEAHYYFPVQSRIKPYVGLGIGTQYADITAYFNIYGIEDTNWGFVLRPQTGAIIPFNNTTGLIIGGSYNFSTNKNEGFNVDNLKHFSANLGLTFSFP